MTDEHRGYRRERPLADLIPPDRRRHRAAALVLGGMIAGAALVVFVQQATKPAPPVVMSPVQDTFIRSFTQGPATADITSKRSGTITPDGQNDQSFELVVDGPLEGIRIGAVDSTGHPFGTYHWGTNGEPRPWQLAVFENATPLNTAEGGLQPLTDGPHRLRLYASDNGSFEPGSYFRVYVVRAGGEVRASDPLAFTGHGPAHVEPKPRIPPSEQQPTSTPFDRGAAAAALGAVNVQSCAHEPGADGAGHVQVVFANDGSVSVAQVDSGSNTGTPRGACIARLYKKVRVPPFTGAPVRVGKSFTVWGPVP